MILYSVIQFVGVIICYAFLNLFSDLQFLWVDLFLILPLSFTMGLTGPVSNLSSSRPPATLFRVSVITSILGHIAFFSAAYAGVVVWGRAQVENVGVVRGEWGGTTSSLLSFLAMVE